MMSRWLIRLGGTRKVCWLDRMGLGRAGQSGSPGHVLSEGAQRKGEIVRQSTKRGRCAGNKYAHGVDIRVQ